jgi:putative spermidine/putrescine transport system ATP-binding protein
VSEVSFLGSVVRIRVTLPEDAGVGSIDTFNSPSSPPPSVGDTVTISFATNAGMVVAGQSASAIGGDELDEEAVAVSA